MDLDQQCNLTYMHINLAQVPVLYIFHIVDVKYSIKILYLSITLLQLYWGYVYRVIRGDIPYGYIILMRIASPKNHIFLHDYVKNFQISQQRLKLP